MTIDCATLSQSELLRPFNCLYSLGLHRSFYSPIIGQGSLLILPFSCWQKAVFLVNSRSSLVFAPWSTQGLLLANLQRQLAEFLKDHSAITLAFSARPLLLVLVLSPPPPLFPGSFERPEGGSHLLRP